jgi:hypothetical protein
LRLAWSFQNPSLRHLLAHKYGHVNANTSKPIFEQFGKRGLLPPNNQRHPAGLWKEAPKELRQIEKLPNIWTPFQGRDIHQDSFPPQFGQRESDFPPSSCHFTQCQVAAASEKHAFLTLAWNHGVDHGVTNRLHPCGIQVRVRTGANHQNRGEGWGVRRQTDGRARRGAVSRALNSRIAVACFCVGVSWLSALFD